MIYDFINIQLIPGFANDISINLPQNAFLSSGIIYQRGRIATYYMYVPDRFCFGEMIVLLILKRVITENEHKELSMSVGFSMENDSS
jgi:hypothetical protein